MLTTGTATVSVYPVYRISTSTEGTDWTALAVGSGHYYVPAYSCSFAEEIEEFKSKAELRREQFAKWNKLAQEVLFRVTFHALPFRTERRKLQSMPYRPRRRTCAQYQRFRVMP